MNKKTVIIIMLLILFSVNVTAELSWIEKDEGSIFIVYRNITGTNNHQTVVYDLEAQKPLCTYTSFSGTNTETVRGYYIDRNDNIYISHHGTNASDALTTGAFKVIDKNCNLISSASIGGGFDRVSVDEISGLRIGTRAYGTGGVYSNNAFIIFNEQNVILLAGTGSQANPYRSHVINHDNNALWRRSATLMTRTNLIIGNTTYETYFSPFNDQAFTHRADIFYTGNNQYLYNFAGNNMVVYRDNGTGFINTFTSTGTTGKNFAVVNPSGSTNYVYYSSGCNVNNETTECVYRENPGGSLTPLIQKRPSGTSITFSYPTITSDGHTVWLIKNTSEGKTYLYHDYEPWRIDIVKDRMILLEDHLNVALLTGKATVKQQRSGVFSIEKDFNSIPRFVYDYIIHGVKPVNWDFTNIDLANRRIDLIISGQMLDNLPVEFYMYDNAKVGIQRYNTVARYENIIQNDNTIFNTNNKTNYTADGDAFDFSYYYNFTNPITQYTVINVNMTIDRTDAGQDFNVVRLDLLYTDNSKENIKSAADNNLFLVRYYNNYGCFYSYCHAVTSTTGANGFVDKGISGTDDFLFVEAYIIIDYDNNRFSNKYVIHRSTLQETKTYYGIWQPLRGFTEFGSKSDTVIQGLGFRILTNNTVVQAVSSISRPVKPLMLEKEKAVNVSHVYTDTAYLLQSGINKVTVYYNRNNPALHTNTHDWIINLDADVLGIPPTVLPTPSTNFSITPVVDEDSLLGLPVVSGLSIQQSAMLYAVIGLIIILSFTFVVGLTSGLAGVLFNYFGVALSFLWLTFVTFIGWIPTWVLGIMLIILGFGITAYIRSRMISSEA